MPKTNEPDSNGTATTAMTVHFAAARSAELSPVARILGRREPGSAANDNGPVALASDALLRASLEHFARHGLRAGSIAHERARAAFFANDGDGYRHWRQVCALLDRRLARTIPVEQDNDSCLHGCQEHA